MSKHDFSGEEFAARQARAREAIGKAGLDWYLAIHPVLIHWLTGSDAKSYQEFQCLLISAKPGPIVVVTREGERAEYETDALVDQLWTHGGREPEDPIPLFERVAATLGLRQSRVGMEVPPYYLHPLHYVRIKALLGDALVAERNNLIHDLKMVKSPAELAYIRRAGQIADKAMQVFADSLREGRSELEVAGEVYHSLLTSNGGLAGSPINLVSGERSCYSHGAPTERKLRRGDFGSVEYAAAYRRYTATIGRQFCMGPPTPRMRELYDVVLRACDACIAEIRAGVPASVPHEAAKRVIAEAGLDRGRVHTTGYSVAPSFPPILGEPMHMFSGSTHTLHAGMVVSVEPPVFLGDELLGARIIDNVLITETGSELLSRFSRELIVVGGAG